VLVLLLDPPTPQVLEHLRSRFASESIAVLACEPMREIAAAFPPAWRVIDAQELMDDDLLTRDYLMFLDAWPRTPSFRGRTFDEMFSRRGGYSLWWTGPDEDRDSVVTIFPKLRKLWITDRLLKRERFSSILVYTSRGETALAIDSRLRCNPAPYEFLPGSVRPQKFNPLGGRFRWPWGGRLRWLLIAVARLFLLPLFTSMRALVVRCAAPIGKDAAAERTRPALVLASQFFRYFQVAESGVTDKFWAEFCTAYRQLEPQTRIRYMLRFLPSFGKFRSVLGLYHSVWPKVRGLAGAAPLLEQHAAVGSQLRDLPRHFVMILRYFRLEGTAGLRNSFQFAGADVSCMYVQRLRHVLGHLGDWTATVSAMSHVLRDIGNVQALLVAEEMYYSGMMFIAAARERGIPTVGVQHGSVFPLHLMYTLPPGQVRNAPTPDYFAAYGEYAKETLSMHGSYPAQRVWVTGATRFDHFVNDPPDQQACRAALGIPQDKQVVFLAGTPFRILEPTRALFEIAVKRDDVFVCVNSHPYRPDMSEYRRIAGEVGLHQVLFVEGHFDQLLAACDMMITTLSTTILEANVLGRRVVCVDFSGEPVLYPYEEDGAAIMAKTKAQLEQAFSDVFSPAAQPKLEEDRQRFLSRHLGPSATGQAARTLALKVQELGRSAGPANTRSTTAAGVVLAQATETVAR
jgi:hypothetical protein